MRMRSIFHTILRVGLLLCMVVGLMPGSALLGGTVAHAQPQPDTVLDDWLASQDEQARTVSRIDLTEDAVWTVSGPFGARMTELTAHITGTPGTPDWSRELVAVEVEGRTLSPEERQRVERHRRRLFGSLSRQPLPNPARLIRTMEPLGTTRVDTINGMARWRIDLTPLSNSTPPRRHPVERATLWFDPDTRALVQSRVLVRGRRMDSPFIVTVAYTTRSGLDVPRRLHIEGTVQNRRRLRDFSLLVTYDATYRDYHFETRSAP